MAKIPTQTTSPITWQTPIVNPDGTMTEPFRRLMQALTGNGTSSTDVVQQLVDAELQEGTGINILPDGHLLSNPTISADVQEILDEISNVRGVVLYRGASGWASLAPGTANFFLQTHGAGADPTWAASTSNIQTLLDGISSTQGVVLYRSASAWVALSPGTSGYFLQTLGAGANPQWAAAGGGGGGAMTFVAGATVSGSAATTLQVTGLNLNADVRYFVEVVAKNATTTGAVLSLYYNADLTATNYNRQSLTANNATVTAARSNNGEIGGIDSNTASTGSGDCTIQMWITNNLDSRPSANATEMRSGNSNILWQQFVHEWRTAATNVTSLTISSSVANTLAVGTKINVWKLT